MFDTLLIANRGEIACRIVSSAHDLGLHTVAVYSDADRSAPHVRMADRAIHIGPAAPAESYMAIDRILAAVHATGAEAVHPGYGFLSENPSFASAVEAAGTTFVGPRPAHLETFGNKDTARTAARSVGVPVLPGTGVLPDGRTALQAAVGLGYPLMVKAALGGGGIGVQVCSSPDELLTVWENVQRQAHAGFGDSGAFLERFVTRARHIEVQVFGDGAGRVAVLGSRDCSLQRRHQKVLEEAPAPYLTDDVRHRLHTWAQQLCSAINYRSAGTVEFLYDLETAEAWFLEGNARLQVEHPVTEATTGIDLVALMLRLARGEHDVLDEVASAPSPAGHAVEARLYAEDPTRGYLPSEGLLTLVELPTGVRVDAWAETGLEVSSEYDPLLAKIIAHGKDRQEAFAALRRALEQTRVEGVETNLGLLREACNSDDVMRGPVSTSTLSHLRDSRPRIDVLRAGTMTTVQDWPGRVGYWEVGIPPSGPMDDRSFRLGNILLGNSEGAPGLECTWDGPVLRFAVPTVVCVTGAPAPVLVDGHPARQWEPLTLDGGSELEVGAATHAGLRTYVLVRRGLDTPTYLGSTATFTLGRFGGLGGRALRNGDVLRPRDGQQRPLPHRETEPGPRPEFTGTWDIAVCEGPHAAPAFLTLRGMRDLYDATWEVHAQSARTGVRLTGPRPRWSRPDGGEAGLHPSNVHDTPYSVGAVNFTGDTAIILGPDGPSLGGFVCPMTVISTERWKVGQLRPGDTVRFHPVSEEAAERLRVARTVRGRGSDMARQATGVGADGDVLARSSAVDGTDVVYRRCAEDNLLVEYGPIALDLTLRIRAHLLHERLQTDKPRGLIDITPGVRSLHLHFDPDVLPLRKLLSALREAESGLPHTSNVSLPSREVHLPLSWDDPSIQHAISRYSATVRSEAAWTPSNIDFIRRINGLGTAQDVRTTVFAAQYLVLGLGDVYLGAPCATPVDPRHRLVATKYNPARTWTPEAAVGIGGSYLCIYGMESPGGYQLVGRTASIWSGLRRLPYFEPGTPWLLRIFDRVVWHPVGCEELLDIRADLEAGRRDVDIRNGAFSMADHLAFLETNAKSITAARQRQEAAFLSERRAWEATGAILYEEPVAAAEENVEVPPGGALVSAPLTASVWQVHAERGMPVAAGQLLMTLEVMKLEMDIRAPADGTVERVFARPGQHVGAGAPLLVLGRG